jgi:hypothetical protein
MVQAVELDLRQVWQYAVDIEGIESMYIQECDSPGMEIDVIQTQQPGVQHDIPHAARIKFTPLTFKKGMWLGGPDRGAYNWFISGANPQTGTRLASTQLKREVRLRHIDGNDATIETFILKGAFLNKLEMSKMEGKSEIMAETGTITYTWGYRV